jgi:glycosyltransferase involved in cell wall biosynthesis
MISILMPIYNGVEFLHESFGSIIRQSIPAKQWELLIGINGHPPDSEIYKKVCAYVAQFDTCCIRVYDYHDCKGKSETLNKMLEQCFYPYVALLDVDDIWLPTKLETQLPFISPEKNYDVVGTKCVYFGDLNGNVPAIPTEDFSNFNFLIGNPVINSSAIIKKELAYWATDTILEDYDLWLRLWKQQKRFYNCPEVLVKHRIHQSSAFNAKGNNNDVGALRQKYA